MLQLEYVRLPKIRSYKLKILVVVVAKALIDILFISAIMMGKLSLRKEEVLNFHLYCKDIITKEDCIMKKKSLCACLCLLIALQTTTFSTDAMTLFYASSGRRAQNVYVEANTTANVLTPNSDYGLQKGRYVSKVTIRLQEGKYDEQKSTSKGFIQLSKVNNPFHTAQGTWNWTYR